MAEQWIIRVQGKEYGPADLITLREWKADGRVLPTNQARRADTDSAAGSGKEVVWKTAGEIPGLFRLEAPPVQKGAEARVSHSEPVHTFAAGAVAVTSSRSRQRNIFVETVRIYFRGFFQFLSLTLLTLLPSLCGQFVSTFVETAPNVNVDLRTLVADAFGFCMFGLWLVLIPIYIAGIQILTAELATGERIGFLAVLNGALKYWPRVAGLGLFVFGVFVLLIGLGFVALVLMLIGTAGMSIFFILVALALTALQVWLFCQFFINVLFWQQFAVLENTNAFDSLRQSKNLARSGQDLPWYRRPLWRGALIVSVWMAVLITMITIKLIAAGPRFAAEWSFIQGAVNQLSVAQDPLAVAQKLTANLPQEQAASFSELGLTILQRILQPLFGIALVVLYLDSRTDERGPNSGN